MYHYQWQAWIFGKSHKGSSCLSLDVQLSGFVHGPVYNHSLSVCVTTPCPRVHQLPRLSPALADPVFVVASVADDQQEGLGPPVLTPAVSPPPPVLSAAADVSTPSATVTSEAAEVRWAKWGRTACRVTRVA